LAKGGADGLAWKSLTPHGVGLGDLALAACSSSCRLSRSAACIREAGELLAAHEWPRLCDADQPRANEVPVAAAIYVEDMYVERAFSEETAAHIRGLRPVDHQRVRAQRPAADGEWILSRLINFTRGARLTTYACRTWHYGDAQGSPMCGSK